MHPSQNRSTDPSSYIWTHTGKMVLGSPEQRKLALCKVTRCNLSREWRCFLLTAPPFQRCRRPARTWWRLSVTSMRRSGLGRTCSMFRWPTNRTCDSIAKISASYQRWKAGCVMVEMFQAQNNEMLWADLAHKLSDQVVIPLNTYQAQFPEMRVSSVCRWWQI